MTAPPVGADYQKVSEVTALPEFVPGLGTLYVKQGNMPNGPYLAYDREGKLVASVYMIAKDQLMKDEGVENIETFNFETDHMDLTFNPGHPGFEKPHCHVVAWYVPVERERQLAMSGSEK